jgi:hypothetical protein
VRSLRQLTLLALCAAVAFGNGLAVGQVKAGERIAGQVRVNPLTATLSLSTLRIEQGRSFQALGAVSNEGTAALSDVGLELHADGQLVITAAARTVPVLAEQSAHEEAWVVCGTQPGSYLLLMAADAIGSGGHPFSVASQAVLVDVTPADRACGGFSFTGFFSPVENLPVLNVAKGGSAIPVKFSLGGDQGLEIFDAGYPASVQIACDSTAPLDSIEQTVGPGASELSYNSASGVYTYVWKTKKPWAGTCRQLLVRLTDGSVHRASFKFKG